MKRYGNLWETITSWDNLVLAARKARRGKRDRISVQNFEFYLETELLVLQRQLWEQSYRPGQFRTHWVYEPKKRMISVAPYRDRVVHHALMNVLEPILDRHFHPDSYACRKEKGTHKAVDRLQKLMQKYPYALQCDVEKFFPSINHAILKQTFRRLIKDKKVLWLMDLIVDSSNEQPAGLNWFNGDDLFSPIEHKKGLPIGNLTSQWFANWALNDLDHFITSRMGIGGYVRYCDDFILLHKDKETLRLALSEITRFLEENRFKLHANKTFIRPVRAGIHFVGYRIWPNYRRLKKKNIRRFRRRFCWMQKQYTSYYMDWKGIKQRLASWIGYASYANSKWLIRRLSRDWKFTRGQTENGSCYSRRQLEQQCNKLRRDLPQQQHAVQSQQQHRVPIVSALSKNSVSRSRSIQGLSECGNESPGLVPAPFAVNIGRIGQIIVSRISGGSRRSAENPICSQRAA
jgi:retron-type reverse transcriptase